MGCGTSVLSQQEVHRGLTQQLQEIQTPDHILDSKQRQIIRETWRQLQSQSSNIGKRLCLRLFEKDPHVKTTLNLSSAWGDELIYNETFMKAAASLIESIGFAAINVDFLETKVGPYIMARGATHVDRDGFSEQFFDVVVKPLICVWQNELKATFTPEVKDAWQTLFKYITQKSKEGYEKAKEGSYAETQHDLEMRRRKSSFL